MKNNIFPCLWFDMTGNEAAKFYTETFGGKITVDTASVINFELFGQRFMILNAGPQFKKNASVSLMVMCDSEEEVEKFWHRLSENGTVLMELGNYPWSKKYGWVEDKFGVSWQLYLGERTETQKIVPTMMFIHKNNGSAAHAMDFYAEIFPDSNVAKISRYEVGESSEDTGNVKHGHFIIDGYSLNCMDNSFDHQFDFNEAISVVVMTDNQEETDHLWNSLIADGGRASQCGWLKDKFGFNWQIVPKKLIELMNDVDPFKGRKVMEAMMKMQKIEIADLEAAYNS